MRYINNKAVAWTTTVICCLTIVVLANELNKMNQTNEELEEEKDELENEVNSLEEINQEIEKELDSKVKEIKSSKKEIESLNKKIKEKDKDIKSKEKQIEEKDSEIKKLKRKEPKVSSASSNSGSEKIMEITAYTAGYESTQKKKGDSGYGITASGKHVQSGVTLACPPSMPFGTKVEIEGIGTRVCHDRGGAITEGKLDLYVESVSEARNFGRQKLKVKVLN